MLRQVRLRPGKLRQVGAWQFRQGEARHGDAWFGMAGQGKARQSRQVPSTRGKFRHVLACTGRLIAYFYKQGGLQWFTNGKAVPE